MPILYVYVTPTTFNKPKFVYQSRGWWNGNPRPDVGGGGSCWRLKIFFDHAENDAAGHCWVPNTLIQGQAPSAVPYFNI